MILVVGIRKNLVISCLGSSWNFLTLLETPADSWEHCTNPILDPGQVHSVFQSLKREEEHLHCNQFIVSSHLYYHI